MLGLPLGLCQLELEGWHGNYEKQQLGVMFNFDCQTLHTLCLWSNSEQVTRNGWVKSDWPITYWVSSWKGCQINQYVLSATSLNYIVEFSSTRPTMWHHHNRILFHLFKTRDKIMTKNFSPIILSTSIQSPVPITAMLHEHQGTQNHWQLYSLLNSLTRLTATKHTKALKLKFSQTRSQHFPIHLTISLLSQGKFYWHNQIFNNLGWLGNH